MQELWKLVIRVVICRRYVKKDGSSVLHLLFVFVDSQSVLVVTVFVILEIDSLVGSHNWVFLVLF